MRQQQDKCSARHQLLILERRRRPLEFFSSHNAVFNSMYDIDRPYIMHVSVSAFQMERHQYKAWSNFKTEKNPCCQILAFILEPLKTVPNQSARNPQQFPGKNSLMTNCNSIANPSARGRVPFHCLVPADRLVNNHAARFTNSRLILEAVKCMDRTCLATTTSFVLLLLLQLWHQVSSSRGFRSKQTRGLHTLHDCRGARSTHGLLWKL